ncbi:MAG: hypothetical protein Q4A29_03095 [Eubacteriales bacterium]|nr:hypothetical protein [Eubacteriales bacterium]
MVFATKDEKICSELENIILTKTPKKVKEEGKDEYGNDKNVYTQKNWYSKWLTSPIVLVKKEDRLILEIPEGYYKLFRESYERYL